MRKIILSVLGCLFAISAYSAVSDNSSAYPNEENINNIPSSNKPIKPNLKDFNSEEFISNTILQPRDPHESGSKDFIE